MLPYEKMNLVWGSYKVISDITGYGARQTAKKTIARSLTKFRIITVNQGSFIILVIDYGINYVRIVIQINIVD
jgi:hypothetical protein